MTLSSNVAISINNVSKVYKIYHRPSDLFWDYLFPRKRYQEFWALQNISLELFKGDVVGIVGSNGAGKSTLLKLITGNLELTDGSIEINGNTSAILELGSGFHPDYTGRENIFNGGVVAGMSSAEIEAKMEEIIDFSGIREFIDQPYKTYSSGMQARLTFSLAISRQTEILILDEALAAGDSIFANKCMRRIKEICESDTTVLFVSHSTESVRRFCNKAVWIEKGKVVLQGDAETVTKAYDRYVFEQSEKYLQSQSVSATDLVKMSEIKKELSSEFFKYGSKEVVITNLEILDSSGNKNDYFHTGDYLEVCIYYESKLDEPLEIFCSFQVINTQGLAAFTSSSRADIGSGFLVGRTGIFKVVIDKLLLGSGEYYISPFLSLVDQDGEVKWLDFHDRLYRIKVRSVKYPSASTVFEHPVVYAHEIIS